MLRTKTQCMRAIHRKRRRRCFHQSILHSCDYRHVSKLSALHKHTSMFSHISSPPKQLQTPDPCVLFFGLLRKAVLVLVEW